MIPLFEISSTGKLIDTKSRLEVTRGWGRVKVFLFGVTKTFWK